MIAEKLDRELDSSFRVMLWDEVQVWYARLVANTLERNPSDRIHFSRGLLVPMEHADGYSISRTIAPQPMEISKLLYDFVGTPDGRTAFDFAPDGTAYYLTQGRYSRNNVTYNIINSRLYVDKEGYDKVLVRAVWQTPQQAFGCTGCDIWNTKVPMTYKILQQIIEYVTQQYKSNGTERKDEATEIAVPTEEKQPNVN